MVWGSSFSSAPRGRYSVSPVLQRWCSARTGVAGLCGGVDGRGGWGRQPGGPQPGDDDSLGATNLGPPTWGQPGENAGTPAGGRSPLRWVLSPPAGGEPRPAAAAAGRAGAGGVVRRGPERLGGRGLASPASTEAPTCVCVAWERLGESCRRAELWFRKVVGV